MPPVTSFTIVRPLWLRGETGERSYLLRSDDGKMCCLGQYMLACGFTAGEMKDAGYPGAVASETPLAEWLRLTGDAGSLVSRLMNVNDAEDTPGWDREKAIIHLFQQQGIAVRFEG